MMSAQKKVDSITQGLELEHVPKAEPSEEIDIDLGDPEVQKAAIFIQAGFRGLKGRKKPQPPKIQLQQPSALPESKNKKVL